MVGRSPKTSAQAGPGGPTAGQRGQETRQRLLAAAAELVQEVGWGSVSTRAIAQRAGLPPGLVHYHFPSVADLLADATLPVLTGAVDEMAAMLDAAEDVPAGIDGLLGMLAGYAADEPASRLAAEAFLAAPRMPRLRAELAALLARGRELLADWLRRHGYGSRAEPAAIVLAAAFDGLVLHLAVDEQLDLAAAAAGLRALATGERS